MLSRPQGAEITAGLGEKELELKSRPVLLQVRRSGASRNSETESSESYAAWVRGSQGHSLAATAPGRPLCSLREEQAGDGGLGRWGRGSGHTGGKRGRKAAK